MKKEFGFALCALTLLLVACSHEKKIFVINDECGPIQGTIFHSVGDDATCRVKCRGTCQSLDMEFVSDKFVDRGLACHLCNCTCRT